MQQINNERIDKKTVLGVAEMTPEQRASFAAPNILREAPILIDHSEAPAEVS